MHIGELAEAVGVSTRAVRHYHRIGLLPEPPRRVNGYRTYGVRDVLRLARVRRLTELGLSLDEAADVLADDEGRELGEILAEIDTDLARQRHRSRPSGGGDPAAPGAAGGVALPRGRCREARGSGPGPSGAHTGRTA